MEHIVLVDPGLWAAEDYIPLHLPQLIFWQTLFVNDQHRIRSDDTFLFQFMI